MPLHQVLDGFLKLSFFFALMLLMRKQVGYRDQTASMNLKVLLGKNPQLIFDGHRTHFGQRGTSVNSV